MLLSLVNQNQKTGLLWSYFDRALAIEPNNALAAEDKELAESYAFTDIPYSVN